MILHLPIEPIGCPRPRATIRGKHASVYMPSEYRRWQEEAATAIHSAILTVGHVRFLYLVSVGARISVEAVFPRFVIRPPKPGKKPPKRPSVPGKRPPDGVDPKVWKTGCRVRFRRFDADNVLKACMDALQVAIRERIGAETWDDKILEIGRVDRWYAAAGEQPHLVIVLEGL